ncbi:stromelysin-2-like [Misgurnus anguillicaudatus]|uniref:stromelysin-2-like n=1 Tax=Misgurnus anguillicaudatus TaxID=75329 RepID=UPI003CCF2C67
MEHLTVLALAIAVCLALCNASPLMTTPDDRQIAEDDRLEIPALNGVGESADKPEPKSEPNPFSDLSNAPEPCNPNLVFDAATSILGELYFFKNRYYWKKGYYSGLSQHKISSLWPSINSVDAAYTAKDRTTTVLFKGQQYWVVKGSEILYPQPISNFGFPLYVKKIDAAIYVASTDETLFFVGSNYWSYNGQTGILDLPKSIQHYIPGIGSRVDAAFENGGYLYFSNGAQQFEYDFSAKRVNRVLKNYDWLNCY